MSQSLHQHRINQYLGLNQQLFDLGVPAMDLSSQKIVDVSKRIRILFLCEFMAEIISKSISIITNYLRLREHLWPAKPALDTYLQASVMSYNRY